MISANDIKLLKELTELERQIRNETCALRKACREQEISGHRGAQDRMWAALRQTAEQLGIRYLYVNNNELAGCERVSHDGWPAVWRLCERLNISGGCGNGDQHQLEFGGKYFDDSKIGYWDLKENRQIDFDERAELKLYFGTVVNR